LISLKTHLISHRANWTLELGA